MLFSYNIVIFVHIFYMPALDSRLVKTSSRMVTLRLLVQVLLPQSLTVQLNKLNCLGLEFQDFLNKNMVFLQ